MGVLVYTSATIVVKGPFANLIGPSKLILQYHDYEADKTEAGMKDFGGEWGVLFAKPFTKEWLGLVKYINFDDSGDGFSFDTKKLWVMFPYEYK